MAGETKPETKPTDSDQPPKKKSRGKLLRILLILIIVGAGIGVYAYLHRNDVDTDDAGFESTVVSISPKVGGYVVELPITDNELVKQGQVLLQIDQTDYKIALAKTQANLEAAEANVNASTQNESRTRITAPADITAAQADVAQAEANWRDAQLKLHRLQSLTDIARSRQELDDAISAEKQAHSAVLNAQARLAGVQVAPQTVAAAAANTSQQEALVKQAQADVNQAMKNLNDTTIISPIAGRISARGVDIGDFVQSGQQLLSVVGTDFWIVANYKETQLTRVHRGQPVTIHIDAYPKLKLTGKIDSIQSGTGSRFSAFPAQNATGNFVKIVQRVPVKITLDSEADPQRYAIGPGLSVEPTIDVSQ